MSGSRLNISGLSLTANPSEKMSQAGITETVYTDIKNSISRRQSAIERHITKAC
jgi:hypothetical protein